jgi:hypothetical protein
MMAIVQPIAGSFRLLAGSSSARLCLLFLTFLYAGQQWYWTSQTGAGQPRVDPTTVALVSLITTAIVIASQLALIRRIEGVALPAGSFLPWLTVAVARVIVGGAVQVLGALFLTNPRMFRTTPEINVLAMGSMTIVAMAFLVPLMIWGTSRALGYPISIPAIYSAQKPGIWTFALAFILLHLVIWGLSIVNWAVVPAAPTNGGVIVFSAFSGFSSALKDVAEVALLVLAARRFGSDQGKITEVFT